MSVAGAGDGGTGPAVAKGLAFLGREVPRWSVENKCFSCHNNGDAARALYVARQRGHRVEDDALKATTDWLTRPGDWQDNGGDGPFSDKTLAALQFTAALAAATRAAAVDRPEPLRRAADDIAALQQPDGSWRIAGPDAIGAPATWGRPLCTAMARNALAQADARHFARPIAAADRWLRSFEPETVLDAAALLIGLGRATDDAAERQRAACLRLITEAESIDGGWGPYRRSPPEPFDTAVVLIALHRAPPTDAASDLIRRGRAFLRSTQLADGSWPETTRPAGATSYAQRLSTTGWAVEALVVTAPAAK